MTEFEYFAAMIAVILALGVAHILGYISSVARKSTLDGTYWIHSAWVVLLLLSHFAAWWNIWELKDLLRFSLHGFLYMLVGPTALYVASRILVPPMHAFESLDLRGHYYSVHRNFFTTLGVFVAWPAVLRIALGGALPLMRVVEHTALLIPIAACAIFSNVRLHAVVVLLISLAFLTGV